jgi:hypothetical protein
LAASLRGSGRSGVETLLEGDFPYLITDLKGVIVEANQGSVRLQN